MLSRNKNFLIRVSRNDLCIAVAQESFFSNHTLIVAFLLDVCQAEKFGDLRRIILAYVIPLYAWLHSDSTSVSSSQQFRVLSIVLHDEDFELVRSNELQSFLVSSAKASSLHQDLRVLKVLLFAVHELQVDPIFMFRLADIDSQVVPIQLVHVHLHSLKLLLAVDLVGNPHVDNGRLSNEVNLEIDLLLKIKIHSLDQLILHNQGLGFGHCLRDLVRIKVVVGIKGDAVDHPDDSVRKHLEVLHEVFAVLSLGSRKLVHEEAKFVLDGDCFMQRSALVLVHYRLACINSTSSQT